MDIKAIHQIFLKSGSVSTDTRKIRPSSLFVAIKGERFDANTFAAEALEKGASHVIIDNKDFYIDERTVIVPDSLKALQELAAYHRKYLQLPIIALTGSNGKTTTKELMHAVLLQKFNCMATVGNLNNHIGVPLTLLSFTGQTEIGIVEMGANHQKEIEFLCELAQPDYGYITNFGKAHLEGFGGVEGVIIGKSELYQYLLAHGKTVFLNFDDKIQVEKSVGIKAFTFGISKQGADVQIDSVSADPFVNVSYGGRSIKSKLIGIYNSNNINAAIAVGKYFGIDNAKIKDAIESYIPENNRSQLMNRNGNEIILDAYNANPSSMIAALENFRQLENPSKLAILGDMFELGKESITEHQSIIDFAKLDTKTHFMFVGPDFYLGKTSRDNFSFFRSFEDLADYLKTARFDDSTILIKGSRGMALERVVELLP